MWRWLLGFLAALLGTLWAFTAWHTGKVEKNWPPAGKFVTVENVSLHYEEAGSGPPVVMLHGAGANLNDWKVSLFDEVSREHRVIAFDRPGHGYSGRPAEKGHDPRVQAALIHGALETLGVEQPVLVGHSWSGALVLAYVLAYPDDVKGAAVLAGVSHDLNGRAPWYNKLALAPVLGPAFRHTLMAPMGELRVPGGIAAAFSPNPPPADYAEKAAVRLLLRPRAFLNNSHDVVRLGGVMRELSRHYGDIKVPLIIISGAKDRWVDPGEHSRRLAEDVPDAELMLIPNVGHMPHHVRPILVTDAITRLAWGESHLAQRE